MKKLLFGLLMMFMTVAPIAAQTAQQPAADETKKPATTQIDCGCEDKRLSEVLGVVNGVKITKQDLSPETRTRV